MLFYCSLSSAKAAASEQASSEITGISGWIQRQKGRLIQMSGLQQQNLVSYHGDGCEFAGLTFNLGQLPSPTPHLKKAQAPPLMRYKRLLRSSLTAQALSSAPSPSFYVYKSLSPGTALLLTQYALYQTPTLNLGTSCPGSCSPSCLYDCTAETCLFYDTD